MAVGLASFAVALGWGTHRVLYEQLDQAIASAAFLATERLVHPAPRGTLDPVVATEPSRYAREVNRFLVLRNADASVAGALPATATTLPLDTAAWRAAQAGRQTWLGQRWNGEPIRVTYVPVSENGVRGERVIQAAALLTSIHEVQRDLFFALAVVVLLGTAATFVGAWALAGSAVRPVSEIIEQATRIEPGDPEPRIAAHADTEEYRGLVAVLNGMLERLDRAFRAQRRLTADVSHELRTPLTALRGEIEVALRSDRSSREYQQVLRSALEEIEGLSSMSEDLLLITRAESRLIKPDRLAGRLVGHVLDNAIRFTPHGGRVRVTTAIADGHARLTVEDSGPGLSAQDLAHIFEPFYRGDPARPRATGHGLGLALVRAVVDLHGGRLRAANAPNGGARLEMEFPLAPSSREG
jgi:signal transduction histidine kinase